MTVAAYMEAMMTPFNPEADIPTFVAALVKYASLPQKDAKKVKDLMGAVATTVFELKALSRSQFENLCICCDLPETTISKGKMLLGTMMNPHAFPDFTVVDVDGDVTVKEEAANKQETPSSRGGGQKETAGVLETRRPRIARAAYHLPPAFDVHRKGGEHRNEVQLKALIPLEVWLPYSIYSTPTNCSIKLTLLCLLTVPRDVWGPVPHHPREGAAIWGD
jgi:hypothetical protein